MYQNPIISKIKSFYFTHKLLSFALVVNFVAFIFLKEKFYTLFYFLFLLYFSGNLFERKLSPIHIIISYFFGCIVGAGIFLVWNRTSINITDKYCFLAFIQSGIIAVLFAVTAYKPNYVFKIFMAKIYLKYIAIVLIIINLLSVNVPAVYLAHLGGVGIGLLYGFILKNLHQRKFVNFKSLFYSFFKRKPKMKASYNNIKTKTDDEYNAIRAEKQKIIDNILDKISKSGYESLSKEEKEFLFSSSQK